MPTWSKVNLAEWQAGPGEKPHAIKQRFTYDDLATADDDMRAKAVDPLRPPPSRNVENADSWLPRMAFITMVPTRARSMSLAASLLIKTFFHFFYQRIWIQYRLSQDFKECPCYQEGPFVGSHTGFPHFHDGRFQYMPLALQISAGVVRILAHGEDIIP